MFANLHDCHLQLSVRRSTFRARRLLTKPRQSVRSAFTLVEMLVAMALTLFIMVILSQCFVTALSTFSGLKGIGDLQYNLRVATTLLQADLAQDHFEGKRKLSDASFNAAFVSPPEVPREGFFLLRMGPNLLEGVDADGLPSFVSPQSTISAPDLLYFTIKLKGNQRDKFLTHRLPEPPNPPPVNWPKPFGNMAGQFAPNQVPFFGLSPLTDPQYPRQQLTGAPPPIGLPQFFAHRPDAIFQDDGGQQLVYCSQWAEVAWYLVREGSTVEQSVKGSTLGTPLYSLYRAQYLLVPNNKAANQNYDPRDSTGAPVAAAYYPTLQETTAAQYGPAYSGVSCFLNSSLPPPLTNQYLYFTSPSDVTEPASPGFPSGKRTLQARNEAVTGNLAPAAQAFNSALVLNNVVSFHVRVLPNPPFAGGFIDRHHPNAPPWVAPDGVAAPVLPPVVFDSASTANPAPLNQGIRALQIIIRAWDPASQQSRQVTFIQEM